MRGHFYRLESIAAADRRDLQMERCVFGMAALVHHDFRSFVLLTDLGELSTDHVRLAEVRAESALPVVDMNHADLQVNQGST